MVFTLKESRFRTSLRGAGEDESWLLLGGSTVHVSSDVTPPACPGKDENDVKLSFELQNETREVETNFTASRNRSIIAANTAASP